MDACLKVLQRERDARGVDGGLEPIPQVGVQSPPRPIEVLNSMAPSTSQAPGVVPSRPVVPFWSHERKVLVEPVTGLEYDDPRPTPIPGGMSARGRTLLKVASEGSSGPKAPTPSIVHTVVLEPRFRQRLPSVELLWTTEKHQRMRSAGG